MDITYTNRGYPIIEFADVSGTSCSLQESSVVGAGCVWLGPNSNESEAARMHLDIARATVLVTLLASVAEGRMGIPMVTFTDMNDSHCTAAIAEGTGNAHVTVVLDFRSHRGKSMILDADLCRELCAHLSVFIRTGGLVAPLDDKARLPAAAPRNLSIKIPASSLNDTDVGGTGISLQDLIDGFHDLAVGASSPDRRERIEAIINATKPLKSA